MTGVPAPTLYHRWLGWHAPAMRRAITVLIAGLIVAVVLLPFITWGLVLTGGWNAAALSFLMATWSIIIRADSSRAPQLAAREDQTEGSARVLLSWAVINTVYTLRYADQHFRSKPGGIAFGAENGQQHPSDRDFAYVDFTIGMCYQVSDTTLRDPQIRRTVLAHAVRRRSRPAIGHTEVSLPGVSCRALACVFDGWLPGLKGREREGGETGGFVGGDAEQAQFGLGELVDRGLRDSVGVPLAHPQQPEQPPGRRDDRGRAGRLPGRVVGRRRRHRAAGP